MVRAIRFVLLLAVVTAALLGSGCIAPDGTPVALFLLDPGSGESPLVVRFDASGSFDADGAVIRYDWSFGDGTSGTGLSAVHTYVADERTTFTIRLTVTDNEGNTASVTGMVAVAPLPAPTDEARIEFVWPFHFDADGDDAANLNDEYFTLENTGTAPVDLDSWTVSNERGETFHFPAGTVLAVGAFVFVHSGAGTNTGDIFYWNADGPVWNNDSDIAVLRDPTGQIIDHYAYVDC
jgi:PKD repeat protein